MSVKLALLVLNQSKDLLNKAEKEALIVLEKAFGEKEEKKKGATKHARDHMKDDIWSKLVATIPENGEWFSHDEILDGAAKGGLWAQSKVPSGVYKLLTKGEDAELLERDRKHRPHTWRRTSKRIPITPTLALAV